MILLPWILDNSSWLIPLGGWLTSEIQGWRSGAKSASVSQIILEFLQELLILIKNKVGK